jgi:hypothetical protein
MGQAASPSLYDFAGGDPVNYFDPTGRCSQKSNSQPFTPGPFGPLPNFNDPTIGGLNPFDPNLSAMQQIIAENLQIYGPGAIATANFIAEQEAEYQFLYGWTAYNGFGQEPQTTVMQYYFGSGAQLGTGLGQLFYGNTTDGAFNTALGLLGSALTVLGADSLASPGSFGGPVSPEGNIGTVTRYVGPIEAQIANETGYIPNVDQFGVPKDVYVTPEAPVATPGEAASAYQIQTPTHVIVGDASGISFNYGGNVAGGTGIEMTTTSQIPVISVTPFAAPATPLVPPLTLVPTN